MAQPGVLVACVVSLGAPCAAQEVDVPTGRGSGSVIAPTGWVELIAPVQQRVDLKLYGFYIGDLNAPSAQVDATIRATKFLSITPSYLYYSVPASGLNELANVPRRIYSTAYEEHQFRIDGTVVFRSTSSRSPSATCMSEGFFQPDDINRYRSRIAVAHPLAVKDHIWKPFASYEAFYDQGSGWNKNRVWAGVTVPLAKQVSFQPSYMWEGTNGIKDLHYLMFGLIFRTSSRDKDLNQFNTQKETSMSKVLQRRTAMLAVIASLVFATAALAQMPTSPWKKGGAVPGAG